MTQKNPLSLKKSVFLRLILITCAAVLVFYILGLTINNVGLRNVQADMQSAQQTHIRYAAGQIEQEFERLRFFMLEMMSDKSLLRYAFSYPILDDYQRLTAIKSLSAQEYMVKRSTDLAESVQIMLPNQRHTIITDQTLYVDLDEEMWQALLDRSERNQVTVCEWREKLWMLLPRYDQNDPLFMIVISISQSSLTKRLAQLGGDQTDGLALLRKDGTVFAESGEDPSLFSAIQNPMNKGVFSARAEMDRIPLSLYGYTRVDEMMAPFVQYRTTLWLLTLLAFGLMAAYLLYYRVYIMRPINDIFTTMRQAGADGRYRIETTRGTDYDDIYAQFNDMVEHIEHLASQVYEEQYRAQKAEMKQLQMQIDPHFLYNSLYLIYRIAQVDGNKSIANISLNLSNYYRYITKMPEQIVTLQDEMNHVMNYLEIQRVRFEPRIHIQVQPLPEEIAEERIPSLIIQPIVENAFQHGVKDRADGGLVSIRYEVEPDAFRVIVADNSGKMDEEKVRALWEQVRNADSADVSALKNLYRRLQLYEGSGHELALKCVDGGLTAIITFHRREKLHANPVDRG